MTSNETLRSLVGRFARSEQAHDSGIALDLHELELLSVPDSRVCREAERICAESSSPALTNHCFRSYAWGALLGQAEGIAWDPELFYAASMFHDLGLTRRFDRGGCFESDGADAAREILRDLGWPPERVETAADAIYLHMHEVTADDPPEAQLLTYGTSADVSGARVLEIASPARDFVLQLFPRRGFKEEFIALFDDQATGKPHCIVHRYMHELGLADRIRSAPYDS